MIFENFKNLICKINKNTLQIAIFSLLCIILFGCANTPIKRIETDYTADAMQNAKDYIKKNKNLVSDKKKQEYLKKAYLKKYYSVWESESVSNDKEKIFWIMPLLQNAIKYNNSLESLKKNPIKKDDKNYKQKLESYNKNVATLQAKLKSLLGYGENLMPNNINDFKKILDDMNINNFNKKPALGIVVNSTLVRAVPSLKPRYKTKNNFPFDRWQNSYVFAGTPVLITHFSKSGRFAHVKTPFVYGWIQANDIAFVDNKMKHTILSFKHYKVPNDDYIPLSYNNGWIMDARIGQIFPFVDNKIVVFYKDKNAQAQILKLHFNAKKFYDFPMPFSDNFMAEMINALIDQKYSWGGLYGNRDCSSFIRDIFAGFGIFLPRNSKAQASNGTYINISKMTNLQKENFILKNAIPFSTILSLRGHVMLYIGSFEFHGATRALVAHDAWNVSYNLKNQKEIINLGGVHITTLWVGADISGDDNMKGTLISRVIGMTNLSPYQNDEKIATQDSQKDSKNVQDLKKLGAKSAKNTTIKTKAKKDSKTNAKNKNIKKIKSKNTKDSKNNKK